MYSDLCLNHVFENRTLISNAPYCWVVNSVRASALEDRPAIFLYHQPLSGRNNACSRSCGMYVQLTSVHV
jgi:hypothetical protein